MCELHQTCRAVHVSALITVALAWVEIVEAATRFMVCWICCSCRQLGKCACMLRTHSRRAHSRRQASDTSVRYSTKRVSYCAAMESDDGSDMNIRVEVTSAVRSFLDSSAFAVEEQSEQPLLENSAGAAKCEADGSNTRAAEQTGRTHTRLHPVLKAVIVVISTTLLIIILQRVRSKSPIASDRCQNGNLVSIRREWRSLEKPQQAAYISAVECMLRLPSQLHADHQEVRRWHDFAWTHYRIGYVAHDAACFLSWHRWFLVLFERSLRDTCGYLGPLPYWDWTLDWRQPEQAPVLDSIYGFGSNGNSNDSWCLQEGPISGLEVPFDEKGKPTADGQCLSRNFTLGTTFNASHLDPQHVKQVLSKDGYYEMLMALERGPHNDIPLGFQGTFLTLYAPAGILFNLISIV